MGFKESPRTNVVITNKRPPWKTLLFTVVGLFTILMVILLKLNYSLKDLETSIQKISSKYSILGGLSRFKKVQCSGNGVLLKDGSCFCDLGWEGATCFDSMSYDLAPVESKSVCVVTESYGGLGADVDDPRAPHLREVVRVLNVAGYSVTVLYVGPDSANFDTVAEQQSSKGVKLLKLPNIDMPFGENYLEKRSYEVYHYLTHLRKQFSTVYFTSSSGAGYYTLLAKKQGLMCPQTKFIVGLDSSLESTIAMMESSDFNYFISDINILKKDFLQQQSVALADTVIASSEKMLSSISEESWTLPEELMVLHNIVAISSEPYINTDFLNVREVVFVGPLDVVNGVLAFCDAIDVLAPELAKAGVMVTFIGIERFINEIPSDEYLDIRFAAWDMYDLKYQVIYTKQTKDILDYFITKNANGRMAVLPNLIDTTGHIVQQLLYRGIPFIGSINSAITEFIDSEYHKNVLINPNSNELVEKISYVLTYSYASLLEIKLKFDKEQAEASFYDAFTKISAKKVPRCRNLLSNTLESDLPLVSIIITHRNRHEYLHEAIASIEFQTYKNYEVIVVDDGSSDPKSIAYLDELITKWWEQKGWRIIREPNRYVGAARNTGVSHALGKYVVFIDDDDIAKPHLIETLVKVAMNTKSPVVTSARDEFSGSEFNHITQGRNIPLGAANLVGLLENIFGDATMLVDKKYFINAGGFTEDYGVAYEEYEFLAKVALGNANDLQVVSESLHWSRHHATNVLSITNKKANKIRMLRAYVADQQNGNKLQQLLLKHIQSKLMTEAYDMSEFDYKEILNFFDDDDFSSTVVVPHTDYQTITVPPTTTIPSTQRTVTTTRTIAQTKTTLAITTASEILTAGCSTGQYDCGGNCIFDYDSMWKVGCDGVCASSDNIYVEDDCGICGGDGLSCRDCKNVRYGTSIEDACGICEGVGDSCFALAGMDPPVIPNRKGIRVGLYGAGFVGPATILEHPKFKSITMKLYINNIEFKGTLDVQDLSFAFFEFDTTITLPDGYLTGILDVKLSWYNGTDHQTTEGSQKLVIFESSDISSIYPLKTYTKESNVVKIYGNDLIQYGNAACTFSNEDVTVFTTADYVSSTEVHCPSPIVSHSAKYEVNLVYSKPRYRYIWIKRQTDKMAASKKKGLKWDTSAETKFLNRFANDFGVPKTAPIYLWIYESAPQIQNINFTTAGSSINVYFDKPVQIGNSSLMRNALINTTTSFSNFVKKIPCGEIFVTNSTNNFKSLLARDGDIGLKDCIFNVMSPTKITLQISGLFAAQFSEQAIFPLMPMFIKPNALYARGDYSDPAHGENVVNYPDPLPIPNIIALIPPNLPNCASLELDFTRTTGSAGRAWYRGNFDIVNEPDDTFQTELTAFRNLSKKVGSTSYIIEKELIGIRTYDLEFYLGNFLDGNATRHYSFKKWDREDVPYVILIGPGDGDDHIDVAVNVDAVFTAMAFPACGIKSSIVFKWSINEGSDLLSLGDFINDGASLVIDAFMFWPMTQYSVVLEYYYKDYNGKGKNGATYTIEWKLQTALDMILTSAGSSRMVSIEDNIYLNAIIQSDAYFEEEIEYVAFSCTWTCFETDEDGIEYEDDKGEWYTCVDASTDEEEELQIESVCWENVIAAETFYEGYFNIYLDITNEETSSTNLGTGAEDPMQLIVVDGYPPVGYLVPSDLSPGAWSSFRLDVEMDEYTITDISNVRYSFESWDECLGYEYDTIDMDNPDNFLSDIYDNTISVLSIAPGTMSPGYSYCFAVWMDDLGSDEVDEFDEPLAGFSMIFIYTRESPAGGYCEKAGIATESLALKEKITIACPGWTTDSRSMPLRYQFESRLAGSQDFKPLMPASTSSVYAYIFQQGDWEVRVTILDSIGSHNDEEVIIPVTVVNKVEARDENRLQSRDAATDATYIQLKTIVVTADKAYKQTSNVEEALKAVGVVLSKYPSSTTIGSEAENLNLAVVNFLDTLINSKSFVFDIASGSSMIFSSLNTVKMSSPDLPKAIVDQLWSLLNVVITKYSERGEKTKTCFSQDNAQLAIDTIDNLIGSLQVANSSSTVSSSLTVETLQALDRCLLRVMGCGQITQIDGAQGFISHTYGIVNPQVKELLCKDLVHVPGISDAVNRTSNYKSGDCIEFMCNYKLRLPIFANTPYQSAELSKYTQDFSVRNLTGAEVKPDYQGVSNITVIIKLDEDFIKTYSHDKWNSTQKTGNFPACVSFKYDDVAVTDGLKGQWVKDGCTFDSVTSNINGTYVNCKCSHLTEFAVVNNFVPEVVPPIVVPPVVPPTSPPWGIIGGAIGGVLVLAAAGAGFYTYQQKKMKILGAGVIGAGAGLATMGAPSPASPEIDSGQWIPIKDPSALPNYLPPPTYAQHMAQ